MNPRDMDAFYDAIKAYDWVKNGEANPELRDEILRLTGQRVDIQIDANTFKSTYQILQELSQVWDSISDISQANLLEMIGGKRNSNVVAALLENFTVAEESIRSSIQATGSASTWRLKADIASSEPTRRDLARAILGKWKVDQDDDVRYADEHSWVKDIFKAETTCWTEERDRYPRFAPRRSKSVRNEELQTGDTTELDSFLASFNK